MKGDVWCLMIDAVQGAKKGVVGTGHFGSHMDGVMGRREDVPLIA